MLSLGVPFDSLQPAARFRIQDGGRNSRTQDYVVHAAHKIRLSINPNIIVNGFLMIRNLSCVSCSSVFLTVRALFTSKYFLNNRSESSLRRSYFQSPQHNFITSCSTTITNLTLRPFYYANNICIIMACGQNNSLSAENLTEQEANPDYESLLIEKLDYNAKKIRSWTWSGELKPKQTPKLFYLSW